MEVLEKRDLGERDGFELVAYKVVDCDSSTQGAECYTEADIEAYREGLWSYVGIVVKAFREGVEFGEDTIWGVEDGYSPGWESEANPAGQIDGFGHALGGEGCYDLPDGALAEAKATLARLLADQLQADRARHAKRQRWPLRRRVAFW